MIDVLLVILALAILIYLYLTWNHNYWKKQNVAYRKPSLLFGNSYEIMLAGENMGVMCQRIYNEYPNVPAIGLFKFRQPQLMLRNIDMIKTVLVKEFNSFHDNDFYVDKKVDPVLALNPFIVKGEDWKKVRSIHTQKQTSGKIKTMFPMIGNVGKDMLKYIEENTGKEIEAKYFSGQYTTDVVGSCVYGLQTNSFVDPKAKFREISANIFKEDFWFNMAFVMSNLMPKLSSIFKLRFISEDVLSFFQGVVSDMYEYRIKNNVNANDYIGSFIEDNKKGEKPIYNQQEVMAHTLTFFLDGYETSSTLLGFTIYILALHQDAQQKLRDEIMSAENLEYDTIHGLPYLDAVLNETLRMYPPGALLSRECNKEITLSAEGMSYNVKPGMTILVPVLGIFNDPKYFPEPDSFKPERFYKQPPSPYFFPFGLGPRACLGQRFALTQIKAALASLIKNYRVVPAKDGAKMPEISPNSVLIINKEPMLVKFIKVN